MTNYARQFFADHAVDEVTAQVVIDLMEDIWAQTDLTPYPYDQNNGDLCILVWDTYGRVYVVSDGAGGLPTDFHVALTHDDEPLVDYKSDGSPIFFARSSNMVCDAINRRQRELERKVPA